MIYYNSISSRMETCCKLKANYNISKLVRQLPLKSLKPKEVLRV